MTLELIRNQSYFFNGNREIINRLSKRRLGNINLISWDNTFMAFNLVIIYYMDMHKRFFILLYSYKERKSGPLELYDLEAYRD